jgi:hypothetical protein
MAKKIIIQGRNLLQSLDDKWGDINNTNETIIPYQDRGGTTEVPPGMEWGMNRGEVERFMKEVLQLYDEGIDDNAEAIETLRTDAIGDVVEGSVNPVTNKKDIHFYKVGDTQHEHPITIQVIANVGGEEKIPRITVTLNTASTIKKGDTIDFDWVYDYIHKIDGEEQQGGIRPTPSNVTIEVKAGNTVIYSDTVNGGVVEHQAYNVRFSNPNVTGLITITVVATVIIDGELATGRGGEAVTIVDMRLSSDFSPASQLAISNGITDGQTISIPYSYTVPNGTTLRIFVDGGEPITSTISGSGRNFVLLQSSELVAGRHNVQMIAENNGLLSDAVIVDFLKAGGTADYIGLRVSVAVSDIGDMPLAYAYGESALPLTVEQFGSVSLDFAAWQSASQMAEVRVYVDEGGTPTQVLSVDRSLQTLSQRFDTAGSHTMAVTVGEAVMGFAVNVLEAAGITETEAPGYLVKLTANGRSNNEANPADWGGITAFDGVNWNTNGWNTDSEGVTSLLLTNGATATININPFVIDGEYSIQLQGFALGMKLKISQVMQRGATVVRCLYDNEGEGYPMGIRVTTEKAGLLFGGKHEIKTAEKCTDENGNYISFAEAQVEAGDNPKALGYYEKISDHAYDKTNDTTVVNGKTYYEANIEEDSDNAADLWIVQAHGVERNIAIDEWIDLFYVALPSSNGYGLGMLFINGVLSRAERYSGALKQNLPQAIVIDSDKADVRMRGLYYYRFPLKADEVLGNTIINQHTAAAIQAMHARNAVGDSNNTTDEDGNIAINHDALVNMGRGVLTIIRSGDSGHGLTDLFNCTDKKQNFKADLVIWEPPLDKNGNPIGEGFVARNIRIRIQGTSSVKYPYKNLRFYLTTAQDGTRELWIGGVDVTDTAGGYPLRGTANSIEQAVLCAKTDFVDSSLAGNTGGAHLFDYTMKALGLLTPPQQYQLDHGQNITVRQAVDGIPCDIFAGTSENGTLTYCGQFVLNNEKSKSSKIFGMEGLTGFSGDETLNPMSIALETLNNSSPIPLFQPAGSANSQALDDQLTAEFDNGMEFNCPEDAKWANIDEGQWDADKNKWAVKPVPGARAACKRWFGWLYDCMAQTAGVLNGTMTIANPDYGTPSGWSDESKAKWVSQKFKDELNQYFSQNHLLTYYLFIDYLAGKDQLVKNILWRTWDGLKWWSTFYDGDTWEAIRNDAFIVYLYNITRDSYDSERSKYAFEGHSSWLWCLVLANFEDEIKACAERLRNQLTTQAMLDEFVGTMIGNWSERQYNKSGKLKYVDTIDTMNYVYTLTGNRDVHIKSFLTDRARLLDARYAVGDYNRDVITFTVVRENEDAQHPATSLSLTSGDLYYFGYKLNGLWLQGPTRVLADNNLDLVFRQKLSTNDPLMLGGASCIKELDFTNMGITLNGTVNLSLCSMLTRLVMPATNGVANAPLTLGNTSKLQYIDITGQTSVHTGTAGVFDVSKHSRLGTLLAGDTNLNTINLPEGAPITALTLPATLTLLKLRYLPNLTAAGLTIQGTSNITGFNFADCPNLDWQSLLNICPNVQNIRVEGITGRIDPDWLDNLASKGGYDANGNTIANPALVGSVTLSKVVSAERLAALRQAFIYLQITECQYSVYEINDTLAYDGVLTSACVKNMENNSMASDATGTDYVASGHAVLVREKMKPMWGKKNANGEWEGVELSDSDYKKLANGEDYNYLDNLNTGNDAMMLLPHCWYKGVNDFIHQKKYIIWSSIENGEGIPPLSSATRCVRKQLSDAETEAAMRVQLASGVNVDNIEVGVSTLDSEGVIDMSDGAAMYNVYRMDVEGMKQVRWPGINDVTYGVCFVNAEGVIISKYNMAINDNDFDFQVTECDYLYMAVPPGAKQFLFTVRATNASDPRGVVIAVDSDEVEAIEPDWVEHKECLVGLYQASLDDNNRLRSLTGKTVRRGTVSADGSTSPNWTYDANGDPTNAQVPSSLKYSMKDMQNLSRRRGEGYQLVDYEMSKFVAILFYCLTGTLNSQAVCGDGRYITTTGTWDSIGNRSTSALEFATYTSRANKCLGLESWFGCVYEWCDNVGVNITSYIQFYKNLMVATGSSNGRWWIFDPDSGTERYVKGQMEVTSSNYGYIKRVRHGRYCDLVPIVVHGTSTSRYADWYYYTTTSNRVLGRSHSSGNATGGVACASAYNASSNAYTHYGSRLAFRGRIKKVEAEQS